MPLPSRLEATLLARGGQLCQALLRFNGKVRSGPFAGMHGLKEAHHSALLPKLIGTYELELSDTIEEFVRSAPQLIINIGAAEGYYAVGLLSRMPHARAIAFESEERGRILLRKLAEQNSVADRLTIKATAKEQDLYEILSEGDKSLLVMDIEGAESELLSPRVFEALKNHLAIVELHGSTRESSGFESKIQSIERRVNNFPFEKFPLFWKLIPNNLLAHLMNEYRPEIQSWGIIK